MFYSEIKKWISPSALANWFNSKASFIDHYFKGETSGETDSIKGGRIIHGLIEGGFYKPQKRYQNNEKQLTHKVGDTGVDSMGTPDSFSLINENLAEFVDYKTGRDISWSREDLKSDIKMKQTAWLVWKETGMPKQVTGFIEWIGTEWKSDTKEVVPSADEYMLVKCIYSAEELSEWEKIVAKAIADINETYERFKNSSEEVVDEALCKEYAKLTAEMKEIEDSQLAILKAKRDEIGQAIGEQMAVGNLDKLKTDGGSFFWRTSKKYEYPETLQVQTKTGIYNLPEAEDIADAVKACKKNYESTNDPIEEKKTIQFRATKKK